MATAARAGDGVGGRVGGCKEGSIICFCRHACTEATRPGTFHTQKNKIGGGPRDRRTHPHPVDQDIEEPAGLLVVQLLLEHGAHRLVEGRGVRVRGVVAIYPSLVSPVAVDKTTRDTLHQRRTWMPRRDRV